MQVRLAKIKDGRSFKISKRSDGAVYELQSKAKKMGIYTSRSSGLTFIRPLSILVYPVK